MTHQWKRKKYESKDHNQKAEKVEKYKDAAVVIKEYDESIQMKGWVFQKFKENSKFYTMVRNFSITKSSTIFKIKLVDKYPRLMKSSFSCNFLKTYFKDIKEIYKESTTQFQSVTKMCL